MALREMDVDSLGAYERNRGKWIKLRSGGNVGVFLLAVSLALFIGLGSFFQGKLENEQKRLTEVSEQLDREDRQGEEEQLETLKDELEAVQPPSFLGILDSVLEPGLEIRQVEWDGEEGLLTIALRAARARSPCMGTACRKRSRFCILREASGKSPGMKPFSWE